MHRKIVVVDREIAFVGGINIVDDRGTMGDMPPRYDYAVAVEGPLVEVIRRSARRLVVNGGMDLFSQRDGPRRDTACFNLRPEGP